MGFANVYDVVEFRTNTRGLKKLAFCCKSIVIPWNAIASENFSLTSENYVNFTSFNARFINQPVYNANKYCVTLTLS